MAKTREKEHLPPRLEAVMIRLCRGADLNKTQAVKLPYLVDVIATHVLGTPITEGFHQAWDHGVVTSQAWRHLDRCELTSSPFRVEPVPFSEEQRIRLAEGVLDRELTPAQQAIVDFVVQEFAAIPAGELGLMTKLMNPSIATWGINHRADTGEDAYERMSAEYQEMARRASSLTLDSLRRSSIAITSIEDVIA
jgi:uncharacterized phage-associated protein